MKKLTLALLVTSVVLLTTAAEAHKVKRSCLWSGNNPRLHMCSDGNSQPRATPSRSVRPEPKPDKPDKPDCKDDDKDDDKNDD